MGDPPTQPGPRLLLARGDPPGGDSARHSPTCWHFWGRCFDAALELRHGDTAEKPGRRADLLRDSLCSAGPLEMLGTLSEELAGAEAIARAERGRAGWCAGEILRAKGGPRRPE